MRCCIAACLTFLATQLWSGGQHFSIRSVMQETPRLLGAVCGVLLFISSLFLLCVGLAVGLLGFGHQPSIYGSGSTASHGIQLRET